MVVVCLMIMVLNFIKPFFGPSVYFYEKGFVEYTLMYIALVKSSHSAVTGASMKKALLVYLQCRISSIVIFDHHINSTKLTESA